MPASLIGQAIGQVFFQKASEARHQEQLGIVVEEVFQRLVSFGMFPFLVLMLLGKDLFLFVFGPQWSEAGVYAQILSPWIFFAFIYSPLTFLFVVLEAQKEALFIDVVLFSSRFIVLAIGGFVGNPRIVVALFSFVGTVILFCMVFWFFSKAEVTPKKALIILCRHLLISFPGLLIILWSYYVMKFHFLVTLGVCFVCTILYYALIVYRDLYMRMQIMTVFEKLFYQSKI